MKQIAETIDSKTDPSDVDVIRTFRADLRKAKTLIQNAEKGIFPGKY